MRTRNTFIALAVVLAVFQLLTVHPIDEAVVRAMVLILVTAAVFAIVRTLQAVFRSIRKTLKTDRSVG